jgi:hypothetical protein
VDDPVVVAVDAGAAEIAVDEAALRAELLEVAGQLEPVVAEVEAVGGVPVIVDGRR